MKNYEYIFEGMRPKRQSKRKRAANAVKAQATKALSGSDSPVSGAVKKIFMMFKKEVRKKAKELKTPVTGVNTDKITIRNKS